MIYLLLCLTNMFKPRANSWEHFKAKQDIKMYLLFFVSSVKFKVSHNVVITLQTLDSLCIVIA